MAENSERFAATCIDYAQIYDLLHGSDKNAAKEAREFLVLSHMFLVSAFLKNFPYNTNMAEDWEDLQAQGNLILVECVDSWDIERGTFPEIVVIHLHQLFRAYYAQVTPVPQTTLQVLSLIHIWINLCIGFWNICPRIRACRGCLVRPR